MNMPKLSKLLLIPLLLVCGLASADSQAELSWSDLGYTSQKLAADHWIARAEKPEALLLKPQQVADSNELLAANDSSVSDWRNWPDSFSTGQIEGKLSALSKRPSRNLYNQQGKLLAASDIDALMSNLNLNAILPSSRQHFGLVTRRSALRTFPSELRAFSAPGDTDIDRFQESALFPGTPVAVLHRSADRKWLFVQSELYTAWVKANSVAVADRSMVSAYMAKTPRLIITGADVRTVFSPDTPEVSDLALDMGISFPVLEQWPITMPVNGQGVLAAHVIELPTRDDEGLLRIVPALVPRSADVRKEFLPVTQENIIRQGFKFLGERYGWGHDYGTRDCSGFVSEVYRSMGITLPRNTSDQAKSLAFDREQFDAALTREQRTERVNQLHIGDLVYIPGHVMMVVGHDAYGPWVIHDSHGTGFLQNGRFHAHPSNGVAITPLLSMSFSAEKTYIDAITAIQHIVPRKQP